MKKNSKGGRKIYLTERCSSNWDKLFTGRKWRKMGITFITKTSSRRCKKKILDYYDIFKILLILLMIINLYITLQKLIIHCKRVTKIASDQCYNCNIKTLKMQIQFVQLKTSQSLLSKLRLANHCLPNENQPIISFFFILFLL